MIISILLLIVSELLPYQINQSISFRERSSSYTYSPGSQEVVSNVPVSGFAVHPYAFFFILILLALFFTPLYRRAGWARWIYWAGILLTLGCTEVPPPVTTPGGFVGLICILLAGYAIHLNQVNLKNQAALPA